VNWKDDAGHEQALRLHPPENQTLHIPSVGTYGSMQKSEELVSEMSGDRIPVGARFSAPVQTGPGAHPASCTMGTGSFPGVKSGWGVTLSPHAPLVPSSRKSTAIPLLPLWIVRPVQSLSACTSVHFKFFFFVPEIIKCKCSVAATEFPSVSILFITNEFI